MDGGDDNDNRTPAASVVDEDEDNNNDEYDSSDETVLYADNSYGDGSFAELLQRAMAELRQLETQLATEPGDTDLAVMIERRRKFLDRVDGLASGKIARAELIVSDRDPRAPDNQEGVFSTTYYGIYDVGVSLRNGLPDLRLELKPGSPLGPKLIATFSVLGVIYPQPSSAGGSSGSNNDDDLEPMGYIDLQARNVDKIEIGDQIAVESRYTSTIFRDLPAYISPSQDDDDSDGPDTTNTHVDYVLFASAASSPLQVAYIELLPPSSQQQPTDDDDGDYDEDARAMDQE